MGDKHRLPLSLDRGQSQRPWRGACLEGRTVGRNLRAALGALSVMVLRKNNLLLAHNIVARVDGCWKLASIFVLRIKRRGSIVERHTVLTVAE